MKKKKTENISRSGSRLDEYRATEHYTDSSKNNTHMSNSAGAKTKPNSLFCHTDPVKSYLETRCCQQPCQDHFILELKTQ